MIDTAIKVRFTNVMHHRVFIEMPYGMFTTLMVKFCNDIIRERNEKNQFVIDATNKDLIGRLYFYLRGDKRSRMDNNKGLYLFGNVGWGKTIILESFCRIIEATSVRRIVRTTGRELSDLLKSKGVYWFKKRSIFIDDILKECLENDWNKYAFIKVMEMQYNFNPQLFLTSNYAFSTLEKHYGKMITDRLIARVNFIECKGESKRG